MLVLVSISTASACAPSMYSFGMSLHIKALSRCAVLPLVLIQPDRNKLHGYRSSLCSSPPICLRPGFRGNVSPSVVIQRPCLSKALSMPLEVCIRPIKCSMLDR